MKLAAIRIRGETGIRQDIKDTLQFLRLHRKNYCVLVDDTPTYRGMLNKVKDFVTFGEVSEQTVNTLIEQKGEEYRERTTSSNGSITYKKHFKAGDKLLKKFFRLKNPVGGFERKGIKVAFTQGGVLGYRTTMNELIGKML